ncbi:MAG: tRNA (adenosine(37)-N6)-threonylcarbamoyltransferase complex dimerization subunit type 1 TsaB [Candidatus Binatia bacterium]|nr:MAG: tRNA (adenosine(37)-N6)-threonylcarbamoyltransferase complex dimerization subunit type 1 TsaB [Candidatus Binatia bacterium]
MRILAVETSTWLASVALTEGERVLASWEQMTRGQHAAVLLPAVQKVLAEGGMELDRVGAIAVSVGPGSFTGLRVGLSVAKGLAYALKLPVIGIPSLRVAAEAAPGHHECVAALLDARKGEVYAALFQRVGETLDPVGPSQLLAVDDLENCLPRRCAIVGDAVESYGTVFRTRFGPERVVLPFPEYAPRAHIVGRLAAREVECHGVPSSWPDEPQYLRPPEAQVHRQRAA